MFTSKQPILIAVAASLMLVQALAGRAVTYSLAVPSGFDLNNSLTNAQGNLITSAVNSDHGMFAVSMTSNYQYDPSSEALAGNMGFNGFTDNSFDFTDGSSNIAFGTTSMTGGAVGTTTTDHFGKAGASIDASFAFDIITSDVNGNPTGIGRHFVVDGVIDEQGATSVTYDSNGNITSSSTGAQFHAESIKVYAISGDSVNGYYGQNGYDLSSPLYTSSLIQKIGANNNLVIDNVVFDPGNSLGVYINQYSAISAVGSIDINQQTINGTIFVDVPEPGPMSLVVSMGAFSIAGIWRFVGVKRRK